MIIMLNILNKNWNNIKNIQKGIKSLISLKTVVTTAPTVFSLDNSDTIANPYDISNTFNNYFASVAETTHKSIKYSLNIFETIFQIKVVVQYFCNLLGDLFNLSCITYVLLSVLKTAKVVLVFNKDSKLDYSYYRPISLLSNNEKILEKFMYKRLYTFLSNNMLFIAYSLDSDSNILHLIP